MWVFLMMLSATSAMTDGRPRPIPTPLYGVTIDKIDRLSEVVDALQGLEMTPTSRIVFDQDRHAADYQDALSKIHPVSYVMGEILDSMFVKNISVSGYLKRTQEFLDELSDHVDVWEVGNEVNGDWLGNTSDVVSKISGAYDLVKRRNGKTALTFHYNVGCGAAAQYEIFSWIEKNLPERIRVGIDYALISYYEDDCHRLKPEWHGVFARLAALFPSSRIGFGEIGTNDSSRKAEYIRRYYSMKIPQPRYIGGYFWWTFVDDMSYFSPSRSSRSASNAGGGGN